MVRTQEPGTQATSYLEKLGKTAVLYDVHGNLPALEAVLSDCQTLGVDRLLIGGDIFPGPLAIECLDLLRAQPLPATYILGNGDRATLSAADGEDPEGVPAQHWESIRWTAERLDSERQAFIRSWSATHLATGVEGTRILFCHATPTSDVEVVTKRSPAARFAERFAEANAEIVVCGHTHMQFDLRQAGVRIVNAGSVGMPFGEPGAYWLLLTSKPIALSGAGNSEGEDDQTEVAIEFELKRTLYDLDAAAEEIRASGNPTARDFAKDHVLSPPSEEQMLKAFSAIDGSLSP